MEDCIIESLWDLRELTLGYQGDAKIIDVPVKEQAVIPPKGYVRVPTGIKIALPKNTWGFIKERSKWGSNGIFVLAGIIDNGYRGEIYLILGNLNDKWIIIEKGERVGQLILMPMVKSKIIEGIVKDTTSRGISGFGSTG